MRTKSFVCCALTVVSGLAISFLGLAFYYYDEDLYNRMTEKDGNEVFKSMLLAENAFVMFYSLENHSNELDENWQKLDYIVKYNETFKNIHMGKVECSVFRPMCKNFHLEKYPSIVWMKKGKIVNNYAGNNSMNDLKMFLESKFKEHVVDHDEKNTEISYTVSVLSTEKTTIKPSNTTQTKSLFDSVFEPVEKIINKFKNVENNQTEEDVEPLPKLPIEEPKSKNDNKEEIVLPHSKEKIRIFIPSSNDNKNSSRKHAHSGSTEEKPWESISDKNLPKEHDHHHMETNNETTLDRSNATKEITIETTEISILPPKNKTIIDEKSAAKEFNKTESKINENNSTKVDGSQSEKKKIVEKIKPKSEEKRKDSSRRGESDEQPASKDKYTSSEVDRMSSEELAKLFKKQFEKVKKAKKASKEQSEENVSSTFYQETKKKIKPKIRIIESSEQSEDVKSTGNATVKSEEREDKSVEVKSEEKDEEEETATTNNVEDEESKEEMPEERVSKEETVETDEDYDYEEKEEEKKDFKGNKSSNNFEKEKKIPNEKPTTVNYDSKDDDDKGEIINISELFKTNEQPATDSNPKKIVEKNSTTENLKIKPKSSHI
ncbi:hypothetical protein PVAND_013273 [Polypedilum vanderplanki]|uniref:Thioredoxin domain-containing protein n=1 Tax=Polypedilum vanderplanki TaxID=319348 RepID=A0A9J6CQ59_POLVA|nr:hypothetical protein PVAND_013273 [Polypedilum vanderplanki]